MFQNETVIVLGAGASKEAQMPLGGELTGEIAQVVDLKYKDFDRRVSGDEQVESALKRHVAATNPGSFNLYRQAGTQIAAAMPQALSIDAFMDTRRDDEYIQVCGKIGIVRCILAAERKSDLHFKQSRIDSNIEFNKIKNTWYHKFLQILTNGCQVNEIPERLERITIIDFNYDRCLEHFLYNGLRNFSSLDEKDATEILKALTIIHPYGTVGKLPWQAPLSRIDFGVDTTLSHLEKLAGGIHTFTERYEEEETLDSIRKTMTSAKIILFLGFAFHKQNMDLLKPDLSEYTRNIYATAKGISDPNCAMLIADLSRRFCGKKENRVKLRNDLTCCGLFDEY